MNLRYEPQADEGGFVIGSHSIGDDVAVASYDYVSELISAHEPGCVPQGQSGLDGWL